MSDLFGHLFSTSPYLLLVMSMREGGREGGRVGGNEVEEEEGERDTG